MGPVLILATLFNLSEKFAGTSGGICEEVEKLDALCQEGRSLVPLERSRVYPGASGLKCPCLQLEIGLPDPDK